MSELHQIFLGVGIALFVMVVCVSYIQHRKNQRTEETKQQSDYGQNQTRRVEQKVAPTVDPLPGEGGGSTSDDVDHHRSILSKLRTGGGFSMDGQRRRTLAMSESEQSNASITSAESSSASDESESNASSLSHDRSGPQNQESPQAHDVIKDGDLITTELVAKVLNPDPIEQSALLSLFREHDFKFQRSVHIYGLNELTDLWRDVEFELPSARFLELGISIQLCDRDGAMSQRESHDFQQMVYQFCEKFDAPFEFSMDLDSALAQARVLDKLARQYDSMAVLNVIPKSKSGFRMADLQSCARDLMMATDKNGIFLKTEGQKNNITVLYRLACTDGSGHFGVPPTSQSTSTLVHDLVMYMKVPATPNPESVFQQMVSDANDLATWLDGKVVDRGGKAMTQRTYTTLMQQISDIAYSMTQDGIIPGDSVTKKLF